MKKRAVSLGPQSLKKWFPCATLPIASPPMHINPAFPGLRLTPFESVIAGLQTEAEPACQIPMG